MPREKPARSRGLFFCWLLVDWVGVVASEREGAGVSVARAPSASASPSSGPSPLDVSPCSLL
jgi:hypothetical protein